MSAKAGKPIKIAGVWVTPKWDWSDDYRRDVRAHAAAMLRPNISGKRRGYRDSPRITCGVHNKSDAYRTMCYVLWLENRDHRFYDLADVPNLRWVPACEDLSAQPNVFD